MQMQSKINGELEEFVCTEHAKSQSTYEIARMLKARGTPVDQKTVWRYLTNPSNLETIMKHIARWRADPMTVDLAHKKVRLNDLDVARRSLVTTMKKYVAADGSIYEGDINKYLSLTKRLIEIEMTAREEIERKPEFMAMWEKISPYSELPVDELQRTRDQIERKIVERGLVIASTDPRKRLEANSPAQPGDSK